MTVSRETRAVTKRPRNVHVLAYFLPQDPAHPLQVQLSKLRNDREQRNQQLVDLLQTKGFGDLTLAYLTTMTGNVDSIGGPTSRGRWSISIQNS
jgi:hypothetical protein